MEGFKLNTGATIPAVGLGTWQADGASCQAAVTAALKEGYRLVDCAHLYGNEREVGNALRDAFEEGLKREEVFISSKLWSTTGAPKRLAEAVQISLKNLGLTYLDLYLLHWPMVAPLGDATDPPTRATLEVIKPKRRIEELWRAMEALVEQGVVRAIGVSNLTISQIQNILSFCKIVPAVHQGELHPYWRQDELVIFCKSKGIHVSAHMPLGIPGHRVEAVLGDTSGGDEDSSKSLPSPSMEGSHTSRQRSKSVHAPVLKTTIITEMAQRLNKTPAQMREVGRMLHALDNIQLKISLVHLQKIILRWGVQRGTTVLPRSLRTDRIKSNFDILNWSLSEADWKVVNSMEPQLRLIDGNHSYLHETSSGHLQVVVETDSKETTD